MVFLFWTTADLSVTGAGGGVPVPNAFHEVKKKTQIKPMLSIHNPKD
jgi:hypothetical protein